MQFKQTLVRLLLILFPLAGLSQSSYLPQGDKANILMERWEIRSQKDSFFNFSKTKPFNRRHIVAAANAYVQKMGAGSLSKVDAWNLRSLYLNNIEYVPQAERSKYASKKPIGKNFYQTPANLYEVHIKDFDLVVNPVIQVTISREKDNSETLYQN